MAEASINVVAGILCNAEGHVLIAERIGDSAMSCQWEFPGGKIAQGESAELALHRELAEEIGIDIQCVEHFCTLAHQYPDRHVTLDFFLVREWTGQPQGLEGQRLKWSDPRDIEDNLLLAADAPILEKLRQRMSARRNKSL